MKILESNNKFKILSERFVGVYIVNEYDNITEKYWQLFDAETLTLYPNRFNSIMNFNGTNGVIIDSENNCHLVSVVGNELIINEQKFYSCTEVQNGIAVVTNSDFTKNYVSFEDGLIKCISRRFRNCVLPKENIGCVSTAEDKWQYAKIDKNGVEIISDAFLDIKDFQEGYGTVQDNEGYWHYAKIDDGKIKVLPANFKFCTPIKEGIGRIVNDDENSTMCYVVIDGDNIKTISHDFKYCFEFNEGVGRVVNEEDKNKTEQITLYRKISDNEIKLLPTLEYNTAEHRTIAKHALPNAEDFTEGVTRIVNNNETISFGVIEDGKISILPTQYQNAGKIIDGVAKVEYMPTTEVAKDGVQGYVVFKDGQKISQSDKFYKVSDFCNGVGVVTNRYSMQQYVHVKDDQIVPLSPFYQHCQNFEKGFGVVELGGRNNREEQKNKISTLSKNAGKKPEDGPFYALLYKNGAPYVLKENLEEAMYSNGKYGEFYRAIFEKLNQKENEAPKQTERKEKQALLTEFSR